MRRGTPELHSADRLGMMEKGGGFDLDRFFFVLLVRFSCPKSPPVRRNVMLGYSTFSRIIVFVFVLSCVLCPIVSVDSSCCVPSLFIALVLFLSEASAPGWSAVAP